MSQNNNIFLCSGNLDLGHVMVGEILSGSFTLTNESEIDLQYNISLLSEQFGVVQELTGDSEIGTLLLILFGLFKFFAHL